MNYFELHIGDYDKATAHLSATEDGIYNRLMRRYYDTEEPLPLDVKSVQRLVRARSRDEKAAVVVVLEEFFERAPEGWRHGRCDEEIQRYREKREKAQRSAAARWEKQQSQSERNANASSGKDANASPNAMRTHSDGNAHQSPDTSNTPDTSQRAEGIPSGQAEQPRALSPTAAGEACLAMRRGGILTTNPSDPRLLAAIAEGATTAMFEDFAREGASNGKGAPWVIATVRGRMRDAAQHPGESHANRTRSGSGGSAADRVVANIQRARADNARGGDADDFLDGEAVRLPG